MNQIIGNEQPDPEAVEQMRAIGGSWAAYQNHALDSHNCGHLQFLRYGEGCTFTAPPDKYPADTKSGMGWRYLLVGYVDLETGRIKEEP